jgi:hypothetical protein
MAIALAGIAYYLSTFNVNAVGRFGFLVAAAILIGVALGLATRKLGDVVFWSAIGVCYGYLAVIHADLYDWTAEYAWPLVGGVVGAVAAIPSEGKLWRRMAFCAATALGLIAIYEFASFGFQRDLLPDLYCATLGGAMMGVGVDLVSRLEKATGIPRYALAVVLIAAAIACHTLAIHYIPGL